MEKRAVAPYVRALDLPDLDASIRISDESTLFLKAIQQDAPARAHPAVCVALALYRHELDTKKRMEALSKMCGKTVDSFMRSVSEARSVLRLPFIVSFEQLAEAARLPAVLASTGRKVYNDIKPGMDQAGENAALVSAAVMLVVAVKRGFDRDQTLAALARVTSTDPDDVVKKEAAVRDVIGRRYVLKSRDDEHMEELKRVSSEIVAEKQKQKVQKTLNFAMIPRREKD